MLMWLNDKLRIIMRKNRFHRVEFSRVFDCRANVVVFGFYNGIVTIYDLVSLADFSCGMVFICSHEGTEIRLTTGDVQKDNQERRERFLRCMLEKMVLEQQTTFCKNDVSSDFGLNSEKKDSQSRLS